MASYSFTSEPRVVSQRSQNYNTEDRMNMNLMYDKRVFRGHVHNAHNIRQVLSPQEQEEINIQKEKERRQNEMMNAQLEAFKKSKVKQTPYDIRPAPASRIEVDLNYFLTDQNDYRPSETTTDTQTDEFLPKPPSPKYVPKKTGMDATTQIWDGDLFVFDEEVQPILNVLTFKTLEQSLLEVEEEAEFESMQNYKSEYNFRKQKEKHDYEEELKREIELIKEQKAHLQARRTRYLKTQNLVYKFMNLNLAKNYTSKLIPNTLAKLKQENLHPDYFPHLLHTQYMPWLVQNAKNYLETKQQFEGFKDQVLQEVVSDLKTSRTEIIYQHKQKLSKLKRKMINYSDSQRLIRFLYSNPSFSVKSEFTARIETKIKGEEYSPPEEDTALLQDLEEPINAESEDPSQSFSQEVKPNPPKLFTMILENFNKVSFGVANHPTQDTPRDKRMYAITVEFYSASGDLLGTAGEKGEFAGTKFQSNSRDLTLPTSEDETITLNLSKLPPEVLHIVFYVRTKTPGNFPYARYLLKDYESSQTIDTKSIRTEEFPEENEAPLYLAYRISKQEKDPRGLAVSLGDANTSTVVEFPPSFDNWVLEVYNLPVNKTFEQLSETVQSTIREGKDYLEKFTQDLIDYRSKKVKEIHKYQTELEEAEKRSKKKKSKKRNTKPSVPPMKMPEYKIPDQGYPTKSFGPLFIDTKEDSLEQFKEKIKEAVDPELYYRVLEQEVLISVRNKELTQLQMLLKGSSLKDYTLAKKLPAEQPQETS